MPKQSIQPSGTGIYHVMMRGINHRIIFEEHEDYYQFLKTLDVMVQTYIHRNLVKAELLSEVKGGRHFANWRD